MQFIPFSTPAESYIQKYAMALSVLVLFTGAMGANTVTTPPKNLEGVFNSNWFKILTMVSLSLATTKDIEITLLVLLTFFAVLYFVRTPEERARHGLLGL